MVSIFATRSWRNNGRIRAFTSRNDDAQSPSVVSIDAPTIHDLPNHGGLWIQNPKQNATVMLVLDHVEGRKNDVTERHYDLEQSLSVKFAMLSRWETIIDGTSAKTINLVSAV